MSKATSEDLILMPGKLYRLLVDGLHWTTKTGTRRLRLGSISRQGDICMLVELPEGHTKKGCFLLPTGQFGYFDFDSNFARFPGKYLTNMGSHD